MRLVPVEKLCIPKIMNIQRPGILEYLSLNGQIKDKAVQRVCDSHRDWYPLTNICMSSDCLVMKPPVGKFKLNLKWMLLVG